MVDFAIPSAARPQSVAACFKAWEVVRDLPDVRFVLPAEPVPAWIIVLLGAMAADRRERTLASSVSPVDPANLQGLQAMLAIDGPVANTATGCSGFLDALQPIRDLKAARVLADRVGDALERLAPPLSPSVVRLTRFVFEELGANIVQHSGRPGTGYGVAVVDPVRRRLELAFADAGVGFRASLQRNPELEGRIADDSEALQLALTPRLSGTAAPRVNMGVGLKALMDFGDLLSAEVSIASGSALLRRATLAGQRTNVVSSIPPWLGSWISFDAAVG